MLRLINSKEAAAHAQSTNPVDPQAKEQAKAIIDDLRERGEAAFLYHAVRLGDLKSESDKYIYNREDLKSAFLSLPKDQQGVLLRTTERVRHFATQQRNSIQSCETSIQGGKAGQDVEAVDCAGCYAPGGRYPLPSSVIMTAVTARVAGVKCVWVASPRPQLATLAAAFCADADALVAAGGAHAIGALAMGMKEIPPCDVIVGPGNKWVTAAKQLVSGRVKIDMLAGPSECLVIADESADPKVIAADLIAQAEHDVAAIPILITTNAPTVEAVDNELKLQLKNLPQPNSQTATTAVQRNGLAVIAKDLDEAVAISDMFAPEHLEIFTKNAAQDSKKVQNYGGLFIGTRAAEVFGDYGAGPNHVLPTGGTARYTGGLSVFTFLRVRTWMRVDNAEDSQQLVQDAVALARMEGLEGHARAAESRLLTSKL